MTSTVIVGIPGAPTSNSVSLVLCLLCILVSPLAAAGLALIHQGLGRSRSAAHAMLATLCVVAISAIVFILVGASFTGFSGAPSHAFQAGGITWNWLGNQAFLDRILRFNQPGTASGLPSGFRPGSLETCLHIFAVGLAGMIPLSTGTDRWRLAPICVVSVISAGFLYPLVAHWVWAGGWLSQLGVNFGLAPFFDAGGAGVIQVSGGLMALSVAWILKPRRGKYSSDGMATAIPGHNIVLVLFGCLVALIGWIGLDAATSMLFYGVAPERIAGVFINAMLSASAGCLTAVATTQIRYRKPDASISANGWVAGLVAGSAACAFVSPLAAVFTGAVAGVLVSYLVEIFELRLLIDDPGGAISVHAGAGIWGLIAVALFGQLPGAPATGHVPLQLAAQLVGIATFLGLMLPLIHGINLWLDRLVPYRVDRDGDWQGMDIRELGAGAYPEFVIHADEFIPR